VFDNAGFAEMFSSDELADISLLCPRLLANVGDLGAVLVLDLVLAVVVRETAVALRQARQLALKHHKNNVCKALANCA